MSSGLGISGSVGLEPAPALFCRVICPCYNTNTITVPIRPLIFHGCYSSVSLFLISAVQLCVLSPTGSTQAPLSHLTAVPWPLFCRAVLHACKATPVTAQTLKRLLYPTARTQLGGISFWDFQSQFPPSAADLHSLDPPQHCTMQIYTTQGSFWKKSI